MGPDFLGVGAQRTGTSWLYAALEQHPAIWLPPIKELHYFDDPNLFNTGRYYRFLRMRLISGLWVRRPLSSWDLRYFFGARSDDWYRRLFEPGHSRGLLTGEITPSYSVLDVAALRHIRSVSPSVKLIYIMRDPIVRSWSSIMKSRRKRGIIDLPSPEVAIAHACRGGVLNMSSYLDNIERLERVFEQDQIFYGFFEELSLDPVGFVSRVLNFLGVEPGDVRQFLPDKPINAVATGTAPPPEFERTLAGSFLPWVERLCERFDGEPQKWRSRYEALIDRRKLFEIDACLGQV